MPSLIQLLHSTYSFRIERHSAWRKWTQVNMKQENHKIKYIKLMVIHGKEITHDNITVILLTKWKWSEAKAAEWKAMCGVNVTKEIEWNEWNTCGKWSSGVKRAELVRHVDWLCFMNSVSEFASAAAIKFTPLATHCRALFALLTPLVNFVLRSVNFYAWKTWQVKNKKI